MAHAKHGKHKKPARNERKRIKWNMKHPGFTRKSWAKHKRDKRLEKRLKKSKVKALSKTNPKR